MLVECPLNVQGLQLHAFHGVIPMVSAHIRAYFPSQVGFQSFAGKGLVPISHGPLKPLTPSVNLLWGVHLSSYGMSHSLTNVGRCG